jgi:hypothetical protein
MDTSPVYHLTIVTKRVTRRADFLRSGGGDRRNACGAALTLYDMTAGDFRRSVREGFRIPATGAAPCGRCVERSRA